METGAIVFHPLDRNIAPQGGLIKAGRYTIVCRPGRHRVEIRGTRPMDESRISPTMPRMAGAAVHEDYIPAAYNTASKLEVEVKAGSNTVDFDLEPTASER